MILWSTGNASVGNLLKGFHNEFPAEHSQLIKKTSAGFLWIQSYFFGEKNVTCVQSRIHLHGSDTCLRVAIKDCPLDGCSSTVFGKQ